MENCIINNKTVALLKKNNKTIIFDVDKIRIINKSINKILEINCLIYGSSLEGRKKYVKETLHIAYRTPIIINSQIIIIQLNSSRKYNCLFLVSNKLKNYKSNNNYLKIRSVNNYIFINNISKYSFEKLLVRSFQLINILNCQKNVNFV